MNKNRQLAMAATLAARLQAIDYALGDVERECVGIDMAPELVRLAREKLYTVSRAVSGVEPLSVDAIRDACGTAINAILEVEAALLEPHFRGKVVGVTFTGGIQLLEPYSEYFTQQQPET